MLLLVFFKKYFPDSFVDDYHLIDVNSNVFPNSTPIIPSKQEIQPPLDSAKSEEETTQNSTPVSEQDNLVVHGMYCDACGFPIIGVRWKCSVCPEINFCESCEEVVNHNEDHPLLRIKIPLPPSIPKPTTRQSVNSQNPNNSNNNNNNTSVWEEIQKVLAQAEPQVAKATTAAKKLSSDVTNIISSVSGQIYTQTKEVSHDIGEKVSQNTSRLIEMCQNMSLSEMKPSTNSNNDLDCPYKGELETLEEMGFKANAYNSFLLNKHKGNLAAVLAELLH